MQQWPYMSFHNTGDRNSSEVPVTRTLYGLCF